MNKFLKVLCSFFTIIIVPTPLSATQNTANGDYHNHNNQHVAVKLCGQESASTQIGATPAWIEVVIFAQNPKTPPYSEGTCDGNGTIGVKGGKYWCREYVDTKYTNWKVLFDEEGDVKQLIRLSDLAIVEFDKGGTVIADNTDARSFFPVKEVRQNSFALSAQEGQEKIDSRFNEPLYRHVVPYVEKLGLVILRNSSNTCDEQGNIIERGNGYICVDYKDKYGKIWRVPFARHATYTTKIIRLSDTTMIEFNHLGEVIFNSTGVGPPSRAYMKNTK